VDLAERRYQAVAPANRLVAATFGAALEETLRHERQLQEAYNRFLQGHATAMTARSGRGSRPCPRISPPCGRPRAPPTAIDRRSSGAGGHVVVHVQRDSDMCRSLSMGRGLTQPSRGHPPCADITHSSVTFATLMRRIRALRTGGATTAQIATTLNREGFVPPEAVSALQQGTGLPTLRGCLKSLRGCLQRYPHEIWHY